MDYDIEREKRKSEEVRRAMREAFPLCDENVLPWAASQIPEFLAKRIKSEVEEQTRAFTREIASVLLEVSPPKTHLVDMARICVDQCRHTARLVEQIDRLKNRIAELELAQSE